LTTGSPPILGSDAAPAAEFSVSFDRALRERIGADRHRIWFEKKSSFALHDDAVIVGVANRHFQEWLTKQYRDPIQALAT